MRCVLMLGALSNAMKYDNVDTYGVRRAHEKAQHSNSKKLSNIV